MTAALKITSDLATPSAGILAAAKRQAASPTGAAAPPAPTGERHGSLLAAARRQAVATLAGRAPAKAEPSAPPSRPTLAEAASRQAGSAAKRPPDQNLDLR